MERDVSLRRPRRDTRVVWLAALAILVGHAWQWPRVLPLIPSLDVASRSPSSDVLLGALPLPHAADRLEAWHRHLPDAPGVVVAHAPVEAVTSAYMVIAMRLWPRPVSLVVCDPTPHLEQFRVPHTPPAPTWRLDLRPGVAEPVRLQPTDAATAAVLCNQVAR